MFAFQQILKLGHELGNVPERAVDGGETYISDLIDIVEFIHDPLTDNSPRDLFFAALKKPGLKSARHILNVID